MTGLTTISDNVFKGMASLTEVKLPSTVTSIGQNAFQNDANLAKLSTAAPTTGGNVQARDGEGTATFGKSLISIGQNAFQGTGFSNVDLSAAVGTTGATQTTLSVGSGAFTNMANLTEVKLPATTTNINLANFGNPTTGEQKLNTITYKGTTDSATATITLSDANISSPNFSKITNQTIEIKSSTSNVVNFTGGVFNGNKTMTKLMLNVTQTPTNGNAAL